MATSASPGPATAAPEEKFALTSSRHFPDWLARTGASLAFTTYQAGKVFLIGLKPGGRLAVFERTFARCMGLGISPDARTLMLATQYQLLRFDNVVPKGGAHGEHDAVFSPHVAWITGDVDAHDVAIPPDGRPVFVNTLFSCIATVSDGYSFKPLWRPPFISKLAPEDRCHLNGMAMEDGKPRYVTLVADSDVADGWRDRRADGGMVMDVTTGEPLLRGLSMPHSPRLHDGRLWLLNSGAGELGFLDRDAKKFEAVAFCPGYARGLAFIGSYAIVGLSLARTAPSRGCRSMRRSPHAAPSRAAGCWWSTPRAATPSSGCASRAWCASCSTSRCCPAYATRPRSASSPMRSSA